MGLIEEIDNFSLAYNTSSDRTNLAKARASVCETCMFKATLDNTTSKKTYCVSENSPLLNTVFQRAYNICGKGKFEEIDKPFFGM